MDYRNKIATTLVLTSLSGLGLNLMAQKQDIKPNIIVIYTDDMGIGDVSFTGGKVIKTPNIDRLAASGKIFTQYYSAAPVCSPSRVALTTGMYPIRWNINTFLNTKKSNKNYEQSDYLDAKAPTIAKAMKSAGYQTAHFGKWHMGGGRDVKNAPSITKYGFDESVSTYESPNPDPAITSTDWIWAPGDSIKRWHRTEYFVDKTLSFLNKHKNEPCFINLWPDDVHTPWVPYESSESIKNDWFTLENLRPVLAEYDKQIGRLVDEIRKMGLESNTLIVFSSDNGPSPGFSRLRANMKRGVKNSLYEGGINMPFFVLWPGKIQSGTIDSLSVIGAIDLLPTLCKIAGTKIPADFKINGEDAGSALFTNKPFHRKNDLFWEYGRNKFYNYPDGEDRSLQLCVRHKNLKLLTTPDGSKAELYDLAKDPNESHDLSVVQPKTTKKLKQQAMALYKLYDKEHVVK